MKKNIVQDVIPPKKSIRNVEIKERSSRVAKKESALKTDAETSSPPIRKIKEPVVAPKTPSYDDEPIIIQPANPAPFASQNTHTILKDVGLGSAYQNYQKPEQRIEPPQNPPYHYEYDEPKRPRRRIFYSSVAAIVVLAGAFGISMFWRSAEIKVTPREENKAISESFTAKKDATIGLGFQVVSIEKDLDKTVPAETQEKVERKAQGKIIIYNNATLEPQKLRATTRFETSEGLIFRLVSAATVPGKQTKSGKEVPGSVEVLVQADKAGEEYNVGLKDFTIPGFKGDPKYTQMYARSKTTMSGGFNGMQKTPSKESVDRAGSELESSLKSTLSKDIVSQIPSNFVLYEKSLRYSFDPTVQVGSTESGATLKKKGTASGIIFDRAALSKAIVSKVLPDAGDNVIKVINLEAIDFSFASTTFNPDLSQSLAFSLKGDAHFVWVFDENKLKSDLLGLSKTNAQVVISTYRNIQEAWIETSPFWNQTIPKDPEKVTLINTIPE